MKIFEIIEKPEKLKKLKIFCYVFLALIALADMLIPSHHVYFWWDEIPGFNAVFGLLACVLIVFVSKFIGHLGIMQSEDFYKEGGHDD